MLTSRVRTIIRQWTGRSASSKRPGNGRIASQLLGLSERPSRVTHSGSDLLPQSSSNRARGGGKSIYSGRRRAVRSRHDSRGTRPCRINGLLLVSSLLIDFFFFKQKTAYEI